MKRTLILPAWLWLLQALTGAALVIYVIIHTVDNATILAGSENYEAMLYFWHESLPIWSYNLMTFSLVVLFLAHLINGTRIAITPVRNYGTSWKQVSMLKHSGTTLWYLQLLTGAVIAISGIWHLIIQHTSSTTTTAESMMRVTPFVMTLYIIFLAALLFHAFNGIRSILIKLGIMTDKAREGILISFMAFLFIGFFVVGVFSLAKFLPEPETGQQAIESTIEIPEAGDSQTTDEINDPSGENIEGQDE